MKKKTFLKDCKGEDSLCLELDENLNIFIYPTIEGNYFKDYPLFISNKNLFENLNSLKLIIEIENNKKINNRVEISQSKFHSSKYFDQTAHSFFSSLYEKNMETIQTTLKSIIFIKENDIVSLYHFYTFREDIKLEFNSEYFFKEFKTLYKFYKNQLVKKDNYQELLETF